MTGCSWDCTPTFVCAEEVSIVGIPYEILHIEGRVWLQAPAMTPVVSKKDQTWSTCCRFQGEIPHVGAGGPSGASELPGTGGKKRPQVRSRAVALSPTGQSWAAATTEGLLLYTLDQGATFDPTDLTEDITPQVRPTASQS